VDKIVVNGTAYPVTWISDTGGRVTVPMAAGANALAVGALDKHSLVIVNATDTITVTNTGREASCPW
jgi:hypothetical protein